MELANHLLLAIDGRDERKEEVLARTGGVR